MAVLFLINATETCHLKALRADEWNQEVCFPNVSTQWLLLKIDLFSFKL